MGYEFNEQQIKLISQVAGLAIFIDVSRAYLYIKRIYKK
jgi:hypothetical protein